MAETGTGAGGSGEWSVPVDQRTSGRAPWSEVLRPSRAIAALGALMSILTLSLVPTVARAATSSAPVAPGAPARPDNSLASVPATPLPPTPGVVATLTVTPSSGLIDNQGVSIVVAGASSGSTYAVVQCDPTAFTLLGNGQSAEMPVTRSTTPSSPSTPPVWPRL